MLNRYTLLEMKALWSEENKFQKWLDVELAYLRARSESGNLSKKAYKAIKTHAKFNLKRIAQLEAIYHHDMIAFVTCVQESLEAAGVGQYKEEFHKYLTSYDVEDPALILLLRESANVIMKSLGELVDVIRTMSYEHMKTLMIACTHAQFAEPTTFGILLKVFESQTERSIERLKLCIKYELSEGKMSGAVGSYCGMDPELEWKALSYLGLTAATSETQILQRDRHATYISCLAITAASIEQMMRTLHVKTHSLVGELREGRAKKQRGSSAMAGKRNPIKIEQMFGMARIPRANLAAAIENIATLEHRDISQSCVERHIFPDTTGLVHYMAVTSTNIIRNLVVNTKQMEVNLLVRTYGVWAGQLIRNALMEAGVDYDTAYLYIQHCSFLATENKQHLREVISKWCLSKTDSRAATDIIPSKKLDKVFDPVNYIKKGFEHMYGFPCDT